MIFQASTKAISNIQLSVLVMAIVGAFLVPFSWGWALIALVSYYIYTTSISMMYHRYWTHKAFEFKFEWMKWPLTVIACLVGKGSPIAWVYVHRLHHTSADTKDDPHSPHYGGFRIMGFKSINLETMRVFIIRDMLNNNQKFLNDWYVLIVLGWALSLLLISPLLFYFAWVLPVCVLQIAQDMFNYFAHTHGYRNTDVKDKSTNNPWLWPFILGEAWHNNHHASPKSALFGERKWEIDPVFWFIRLVKK